MKIQTINYPSLNQKVELGDIVKAEGYTGEVVVINYKNKSLTIKFDKKIKIWNKDFVYHIDIKTALPKPKQIKPDLVQIDFRVSGDLGEEMNDAIDYLEKEFNKILIKRNYKEVNMEWEN